MAVGVLNVAKGTVRLVATDVAELPGACRIRETNPVPLGSSSNAPKRSSRRRLRKVISPLMRLAGWSIGHEGRWTRRSSPDPSEGPGSSAHSNGDSKRDRIRSSRGASCGRTMYRFVWPLAFCGRHDSFCGRAKEQSCPSGPPDRQRHAERNRSRSKPRLTPAHDFPGGSCAKVSPEFVFRNDSATVRIRVLRQST